MTRLDKELAETLSTKRLLSYYKKAFIREKKIQANLEKEADQRRTKFRMEEEEFLRILNESEDHLIMVKFELNKREHVEKIKE